MSIKLLLEDLSNDQKNKITSELKFQKKETQYNKMMPQPSIHTFDISEEDGKGYIYLPFYWTLKNIANSQRPNRETFPPLKTKFIGKLRPLQKDVKTEAQQLLQKNGTCLLSLYTGAGKTITSIYLANKIGLKTLIIVHRLCLLDQWKQSIEKVCDNPKIQILTAKTKIDRDCDFYLMNAINVCKRQHGEFNHVGTFMVDEIHVMATEKLAQSFYYVTPRYCIGLSATPYRSDGMDELINVYFSKKRISRKLFRQHYAFKVITNFIPDAKMLPNGKLDWNSVLESQTTSIDRNEMIVNIVKCFHDRNFLILSKRVKQVEYIEKRLKEDGVDVTSLVGVKKKFDYNSRVLVATVQKAGVGFDHPKLNSLIIASDVEEYFIQYLGRVFRTEHGIPIIFDLLDDFNVLKKHYYTRRKTYIEHGGIIKKFCTKEVNEFPQYNFKKYFKDF
tara:strand:+ start:2654 stop:3991 length:1338 start_codon:yes stop_codon:yes gene_type:complete